MSILTGKEIQRQVELGRILIDPFDARRLNPNSYNLRLDKSLLLYTAGVRAKRNGAERASHIPICTLPGSHPDAPDHPSLGQALDMAASNNVVAIDIPPTGAVLFPGMLYLGSTVERAGSDFYVPLIEGRSSIGRLGIHVHVTAGFGDLGFKGTWTCEITVVHPVRVYAGVEICQVVFMRPEQDEALGELRLYRGKYTNQRGPRPSDLWRELATAKGTETRQGREQDHDTTTQQETAATSRP
jgi:dCTP deaminase